MSKMERSLGLRVAVTGAAGFIGRAVVNRILAGRLGEIAALRLNDMTSFDCPQAEWVVGSYADSPVRERLVGDGVDVVFHLASLPGGAAERDPALGKAVNLDGSIALIDAVAGAAAPVFVYTSSIAVLGGVKQPVDDATALRPTGGYGTHKAMVEYYLADLTRRGVINGRAVRPAGVVARPRDAYAGFVTAWMSDLFHAAAERRDISIPARADSHIWLQSIDVVADNIIHAALMLSAGAWTLPATVVRVGDLVESLGRATGSALRVEYGDIPTDHPPLDASGALAAGFVSDGDTDALVAAVLRQIGGLPTKQ